MKEEGIIRETLLEELDRNLRSQSAYEHEISLLPKGSVALKSRGKHEYVYLKFRDGSQVKTQYVGPADKYEFDIRSQVEKRKELEQSLRNLKAEQKFIQKALKIK